MEARRANRSRTRARRRLRRVDRERCFGSPVSRRASVVATSEALRRCWDLHTARAPHPLTRRSANKLVPRAPGARQGFEAHRSDRREIVRNRRPQRPKHPSQARAIAHQGDVMANTTKLVLAGWMVGAVAAAAYADRGAKRTSETCADDNDCARGHCRAATRCVLTAAPQRSGTIEGRFNAIAKRSHEAARASPRRRRRRRHTSRPESRTESAASRLETTRTDDAGMVATPVTRKRLIRPSGQSGTATTS